MLTITGIIGGIFFYLIGYGWIGLLGWFLGGLLGDVVLKIGGYQKFKVTVLSYACFCLGIMGCPANLWFAGEAYWENIHTSMGDQYANTLQSLMPSWMLYVGFVLLFVGGILGALLGHKMLKNTLKERALCNGTVAGRGRNTKWLSFRPPDKVAADGCCCYCGISI